MRIMFIFDKECTSMTKGSSKWKLQKSNYLDTISPDNIYVYIVQVFIGFQVDNKARGQTMVIYIHIYISCCTPLVMGP